MTIEIIINRIDGNIFYMKGDDAYARFLKKQSNIAYCQFYQFESLSLKCTQ